MPEGSLSATGFVGVLDPGDERDGQHVAVLRAPVVEDVLLQQGVEGLRGSGVPSRSTRLILTGSP